jgi:uncharacterized membrane protein YfcA
VTILTSIFSSVSGIGGSGILIPLFQVIGWFEFLVSVGLAKVVVFGMSIMNVLILVFKKIPNTNMSLINYELSILVIPFVVAGSYLGVLLNFVLPDILKVVVLTLILSYSGYRSIKSSCQMKKEQEEYQLIQGEVMSSIWGPITSTPFLAIIWIISVVFIIFKGGNSFQSVIGVQLCSTVLHLCSLNF